MKTFGGERERERASISTSIFDLYEHSKFENVSQP